MQLPKKGIYRHFKGGEYELLYIARHSETDEPMVVYRALYEGGQTPDGEGVWVRPLSMWDEEIERDGQRFRRFSYVGEAEPPVFEGEGSIYAVPDADLWEPAQAAPAQKAHAALDLEPGADKRDVLKRVFGYDAFRPGQEELVDAIVAGRDVLGVMPTGAGKSMCYQVPALVLPGCALVISPLISLMKDQVGQLVQSGVPAAYLNSSLTERQMSLALDNAAQGKYRVIYVAPERLNTPRFLGLCRRMRISLVAVDEAHCISQWGQDFRPSYLEIPNFLAALEARPRLCAFTATATRRVREDIARLLRLQNPFELVTGFDRANLYFKVLRPARKRDALLGLMEKYRGMSGIVYCATRKDVEAVCDLLLSKGVSATRYHAGLSDGERRQNQEDFTFDRRQVMVATNAFGMGIDKSDVRFVIHYNMPGDLESYYQEAGRAGRDGERADCVLLYGRQDEMTQRFFIDKMGDESDLDAAQLRQVRDAARARLERMIGYCRTPSCLRAEILRYFGEAAGESCGFCGNCVEAAPNVDVTEMARTVLECVRGLNGRYGQALVVQLLRGASDKRVRQLGLERDPNYGALRACPRETLNELVGQLIGEGYLETRGGKYPVLALGGRAGEVLEAGESVHARLSAVPGATGAAQIDAQDALSAEEQELYMALRAVRSQLARRRGVPAYVIFNDSVLRGICRRRPATEDELGEVSGVGQAKLRAYGKDFLRAIRAHREKQK